jgi:hypothetical protein
MAEGLKSPDHVGADESIILSAEPVNLYGQSLRELDDNLFRRQMVHIVSTPHPYDQPLLQDVALQILKEPEIYDDFIEEAAISTNPAIERVLIRVRASRDEANTRLLRVLRNSVAALIYKGEYRANDPIWDELSARL